MIESFTILIIILIVPMDILLLFLNQWKKHWVYY